MIKNKRTYIVLICFVLILAFTIVIADYFVFAPLKVTVSSIKIYQEKAMDNETEEERLDFLKLMYEESKRSDTTDMVDFWKGEPPSFANLEDYLYVTYTINIDNPTFVKSSSCAPAFDVEEIDLSDNFFITNDVQIAGFYIKRRSETEETFCLWAYKSDFTKDKIEDFVHSVVLKLNYYNRFQKRQSVKIDTKNANIEFVNMNFE
jgi:hypothetical protein